MARVFLRHFASAVLGCTLCALAAAPLCAQTYVLTNTTFDSSHPLTDDLIAGKDSTGTVNASPTVNILGLTTNYVVAYNSSVVHADGSSLNDVYFYDSSTFNVSNSTLRNHIYSYDNSTINVSSGDIAIDLRGADQSHIYFTGGSIGQYLSTSGHNVTFFSGGSVARGAFFAGDSAVTVSGGSFGQNMGINFIVEDNSALTLVGSGLTLTDIGPYAGLGEGFALGGYLADGTDLTGYTLVKSTGFTGSVTLQPTPEPGSMALLAGLGLTGATFLRRRKRDRKAA